MRDSDTERIEKPERQPGELPPRIGYTLPVLGLVLNVFCPPLGFLVSIHARTLLRGCDRKHRQVVVAETGIATGFIFIFLAVWFLKSELFRHRGYSNEPSAIGSLKTIVAGEEQFRCTCSLDEDGDSIGEYGLFEELGGAADIRGADFNCKTAPFIPSIFGNVDARGRVRKGGYYFVLYLAGKDKAFCQLADAVKEGVNVREETYVCYAFPVEYGKSGHRLFVVDCQGVIMHHPNPAGIWSGDSIPPPGLAYRSGKDPSTGSAEFVGQGDFGGSALPWRTVD
jgi:hypothetical protein